MMKDLIRFLLALTLVICPTSLKASEKKLHKIAIIDSGFNLTKYSKVQLCPVQMIDFTGTGIKDNWGHGSHIANSIADRINNNNYCFVIIKVFDPNFYGSVEQTASAFKLLLDTLKKGDYINYSAGGPVRSNAELLYMFLLLKRGVNIFVAAGNEGINLDKHCDYFPACYHLKKLNVIGSIYKNGTIVRYSNYGKVVTGWENGVDVIADNGTGQEVPMSGTSQSTALALAKAVNKCNDKSCKVDKTKK